MTQNFDNLVDSLINEAKFSLEKKYGLRGWFMRNKGKGWVNCKRSKPGHIVPCGRKKAKGGSYPACRPTLSMCSSRKKHKKSKKRISWKKGAPAK